MEIFICLVVLLCYLPPILYLRHHLQNLESPAYLRAKGVVINRLEAIDNHGPAIGSYMGLDIWSALTFKGMCYEFDHVAPENAGLLVGPCELFLAPGLVYVTR